MATAFVSIGSNKGNKISNCRRAIAEISRLQECSVKRCSSFYETEPYGVDDKRDWFVNTVIEIETSKKPDALLTELLNIEKRFGRIREPNKYTPRTLDLDLLLYDNEIINSDFLTLPHPRMHMRKFVLEPLNEISPNSIHPILNRNVKTLLGELKDDQKIRKFET